MMLIELSPEYTILSWNLPKWTFKINLKMQVIKRRSQWGTECKKPKGRTFEEKNSGDLDTKERVVWAQTQTLESVAMSQGAPRMPGS